MIVLKHFHYSNFIPKIKLNKKVSFNIAFTPTCEYYIEEKSCVNKLFGLSYFLPHTNSDRFGWTWNKDHIDIYTYSYDNGVLHKEKFTEAHIGDKHKYQIETKVTDEHRTVTFTVDNKSITKVYSKPTKFTWTLGLYFGGKTRAPHKVIVSYEKV